MRLGRECGIQPGSWHIPLPDVDLGVWVGLVTHPGAGGSSLETPGWNLVSALEPEGFGDTEPLEGTGIFTNVELGRTRGICGVLVEGNQMFPAGRSSRKPELRAALPLEEAAP